MKKVIALLLAVAAVPALAQIEPKPAPKKVAPVQRVDFGEGDLIEGGLATGEVDIYLGVKRPGFESLLRVRQNFNDKLRESVHEL